MLKFFICVGCAGFMLTAKALAGPEDCRDIQLRNSIAAERLWADINKLASKDMEGRETLKPGNLLAQQYLIERFDEIGLRPLNEDGDFRQPFAYKRGWSHIHGTNLVGLSPGTLEDPYTIIITAHYDHVGKEFGKLYLGADDNASGVAALLALADAINQQPLGNNILFVATDAEEKGLIGAKALMEKPPVPRHKIKANVNLDMIANGGGRRRLYVIGARQYPQLLPVVEQGAQLANVCLKPGRNYSPKTYDRYSLINWRVVSDHAVFDKLNIPYLFFTAGDHAYYHSELDTVERINPTFYTGVVETILASIRLLDTTPL